MNTPVAQLGSVPFMGTNENSITGAAGFKGLAGI